MSTTKRNVPLRKLTPEEVQAVEAIARKLEGNMLALYDRWQDEKAYEPWSDYARVLEDKFGTAISLGTFSGIHEVVFKLAGHTPWTLEFTINGQPVWIGIRGHLAPTYEWGRT